MVTYGLESFTLPHQLKDELFIAIDGYTKDPLKGISWKKHIIDGDHIGDWVRQGNNYAITYSSNLAVIDADNFGRLCELCDLTDLAETYMVQSGRDGSRGVHIYVRIPDETIPDMYKGNKVKCSRLVLHDPATKEEVGDIRFPHCGFYNIGPYSIHPKTKKQYLPFVENSNIMFFSGSRILEIFDSVIPVKEEKADEDLKTTMEKNNYVLDGELDYGFTCTDFLKPTDPHKRSDGSLEGGHPVHGSNTGSNLTISPDGSMWWCRRCQTGGGWKKALAVCYGIIDCSEANRDFTHDEARQIRDILQTLNPVVHEKRWIAYQQRKANRYGEKHHEVTT